jgi:hypothetical protein
VKDEIFGEGRGNYYASTVSSSPSRRLLRSGVVSSCHVGRRNAGESRRHLPSRCCPFPHGPVKRSPSRRAHGSGVRVRVRLASRAAPLPAPVDRRPRDRVRSSSIPTFSSTHTRVAHHHLPIRPPAHGTEPDLIHMAMSRRQSTAHGQTQTKWKRRTRGG